MKTVRKITARTIGLESEPGYGFKLMGKLRFVQEGKTDKGPFFRLKGTFEAHPYNPDGEAMEPVSSGQAILPGVVEDSVVMALKEAQDKDPGASILFAYDIRLEEADNAMGKQWVGEPLTEMSDAGDAFAGLRKTLGLSAPPKDKKALPAPKNTKKK